MCFCLCDDSPIIFDLQQHHNLKKNHSRKNWFLKHKLAKQGGFVVDDDDGREFFSSLFSRFFYILFIGFHFYFVQFPHIFFAFMAARTIYLLSRL